MTPANTLYCEIETWEDPGDYPNAIAASPLPTDVYCVWGGEFIFELSEKEIETMDEWIEDPFWIVDYIKEECKIDSDCHPKIDVEIKEKMCKVTIYDAEVVSRDYYE